MARRGGRGTKHPAWEHFVRLDVMFDLHHFFARCRYCNQDMPAAELQALQDTLRPDAALDADERKRVRTRAKGVGIVKGRALEMNRHLKLYCADAPAEVTDYARGMLSEHHRAQEDAKVVKEEEFAASGSKSRLPRNSVAALKMRLNGAGKDGGAAGAASPSPKKRQRVAADAARKGRESFASTDGAVMAVARSAGVRRAAYEDSLVLLMAMHDLPFRVFESGEWKALVSSLCGVTAEGQTQQELFPNRRRMADVVVPRMYEEARKRLQTRVDSASKSSGLTVVICRESRQNRQYRLVISASGRNVHPVTIAVCSLYIDSRPYAAALAREWEELILLAGRSAPVEDYPRGHFVALPQIPVALCCNDTPRNRHARDIIALRHPTLVFIPCFAHQVTLLCGDLLTRGKHAKVVAQSLKLVTFFSDPNSAWHGWLRNEMRQTYGGKEFDLETGFITQWSGLWLSSLSVLRVKAAMQNLLFYGPAAIELEREELLSTSRMEPRAPLEMKDVVSDPNFWKSLETFTGQMLPAVEAALALEEGSATLGDAMFAIARIYQVVACDREADIVAAMERRFSKYEIPLLFMAFWLHPRYKPYGDLIVRNGGGGVDMVLAAEWVDGYLDRWFPAVRQKELGGLPSVLSGLCAWQDSSDATLRHAPSMKDNPGRFWRFVKDALKRHAATSSDRAGLYGLALVAEKLFTVLTYTTNAEQLFGDIVRRSFSTDSASTPALSPNLVAIAEDCRASQREAAELAVDRPTVSNVEGAKKPSITHDTLCKIGHGGVSAVVETASLSLQSRLPTYTGNVEDFSSGGGLAGSTEESMITIVSAGATQRQQEPAEAAAVGGLFHVQPRESSCAHLRNASAAAYEVGKEKDWNEAADVEATKAAIEDFDLFGNTLIRSLDSEDGSKDTGEEQVISFFELEENARSDSLEKYKVGCLPLGKDASIPFDRLQGFRGWKGTLTDLFNEDVTGRLPNLLVLGGAHL